MSAATTLHPSLTRTSADDREEARLEALATLTREGLLSAEQAAMNESVTGPTFNAALAAIQRREAEAVADALPASFGAVAGGDWRRKAVIGPAQAAVVALKAHFLDGRGILTLDQRARLLDAARTLVALALEVAG
jgi:hypothetical protein